MKLAFLVFKEDENKLMMDKIPKYELSIICFQINFSVLFFYVFVVVKDKKNKRKTTTTKEKT